jgi:hypothetical protein
MKSDRITLRADTEETKLLEKARAILFAKVGREQTISKTVKAGLEHLANDLPNDRPELFFVDRVNIYKVEKKYRRVWNCLSRY